MEIESLKFVRPLSAEKVLFLRGLPDLPWNIVWCYLQEKFRCFGPLYSAYVPTGNNVGYAIVQFYSKKSAQSALLSTRNNLILDNNKIKVCISSICVPAVELPLHLSKCYELANYYFSFNGWNIRLLELRIQHSQYHCTVELNLPQYSVRVCGVGLASMSIVDQTKSDEETECHFHGNSHTIKAAYRRACERAFAQIVIILEDNGTIKVRTEPV